MRIIHSSDWHLGHKICGQKRNHEFESFFDWLIKLIGDEKVDLLIIAGDIFDTKNPGHFEQELYYDFLGRFAENKKKQMVISSGNHDSPGFLAAPKELLKHSGIFIVAENATAALSPLVIPKGTEAGAIVCALPYFREGDLREMKWAEENADEQIVLGLKNQYQKAVQQALQIQTSLKKELPIMATGHLFTQKGQVSEDDGTRPLYIGNLGQVPAEIFPDEIDYLALGHLHAPQMIGGKNHFRYSGSILPMNFHDGPKSICLIDFSEKKQKIEIIPIPKFQNIISIKGDLAKIKNELTKLNSNGYWLEIIYNGTEIIGDLKSQIDPLVFEHHNLLRLKNLSLENIALPNETTEKDLTRLTPADIFERLLQSKNIPDNQCATLREKFNALLFELDNQEPEEK